MYRTEPGLVKSIAWVVLALLTAGLCFWADPQFAQFAAFALFFTIGIGLVLAVDHWLMPEYESFEIISENPLAVSIVVAGLLVFAGMCAIAAVWAFAPVPAVASEYSALTPADTILDVPTAHGIEAPTTTTRHGVAIRRHTGTRSEQRMVDGSSKQVRWSTARLELLRQLDQSMQLPRRGEVADSSDSMGARVRDTRPLVHDQRHLVGAIHAAAWRHPRVSSTEGWACGIRGAIQGEGCVRDGGVQYVTRGGLAA